jgi:dihydroxy-acid dehydratase
VEDDDIIELDAIKNTITLKVDEEAIAERRARWRRPSLKATKGILFKYAMHVTSAANGCVTDEPANVNVTFPVMEDSVNRM